MDNCYFIRLYLKICYYWSNDYKIILLRGLPLLQHVGTTEVGYIAPERPGPIQRVLHVQYIHSVVVDPTYVGTDGIIYMYIYMYTCISPLCSLLLRNIKVGFRTGAPTPPAPPPPLKILNRGGGV